MVTSPNFLKKTFQSRQDFIGKNGDELISIINSLDNQHDMDVLERMHYWMNW